jgi:hypothetical protein
MKHAILLAMMMISGLGASASGQEAIAKEYGYKFAGETAEAAYFMSGIRRGAEPGSVEAWVWTVSHTPVAAADLHDAKAELSVWRCEGRSFEVLKTELYHEGALLSATAEPPMIPKQIRPDTPMSLAWQVACDMDKRYNSQTLADLNAVYRASRSD